MNLLSGTEMDVQEKKEMEIRDRKDGQEMKELKEEEIREALKKMKNKKAASGIDEIPMEAWKFVERILWKNIIELLGQVWKQGEILKDWKRSIIVPLYKRGDTKSVGNYKGISLLYTAYKWYAEWYSKN